MIAVAVALSVLAYVATAAAFYGYQVERSMPREWEHVTAAMREDAALRAGFWPVFFLALPVFFGVGRVGRALFRARPTVPRARARRKS